MARRLTNSFNNFLKPWALLIVFRNFWQLLLCLVKTDTANSNISSRAQDDVVADAPFSTFYKGIMCKMKDIVEASCLLGYISGQASSSYMSEFNTGWKFTKEAKSSVCCQLIERYNKADALDKLIKATMVTRLEKMALQNLCLNALTQQASGVYDEVMSNILCIAPLEWAMLAESLLFKGAKNF